MARLAEIASSKGGKVLELGFGMSISASFIQPHAIEGHWIIEAAQRSADCRAGFATVYDAPHRAIPAVGEWSQLAHHEPRVSPGPDGRSPGNRTDAASAAAVAVTAAASVTATAASVTATAAAVTAACWHAGKGRHRARQEAECGRSSGCCDICRTSSARRRLSRCRRGRGKTVRSTCSVPHGAEICGHVGL